LSTFDFRLSAVLDPKNFGTREAEYSITSKGYAYHLQLSLSSKFNMVIYYEVNPHCSPVKEKWFLMKFRRIRLWHTSTAIKEHKSDAFYWHSATI